MKNLVLLLVSVLALTVVSAQQPNFSYFDEPVDNADPSKVLIYRHTLDMQELQEISSGTLPDGIYNISYKISGIVDKTALPPDSVIADSGYGNGTLLSDSELGELLLTAEHLEDLIDIMGISLMKMEPIMLVMIWTLSPYL